MTFKNTFIHTSFKLNGVSYTKDTLYEQSIYFLNSKKQYEVYLGSFLHDWLDEKKHQIEVLTSGSTGKPKVINLDKQKIIHSAVATGEYFGLTPNTTALLCLFVKHIGGLMMVARSLTLGWHLDVIEPKVTLHSINKSYDFCAMTPHQLQNSLSQIHYIDKLILGGGRISYNLMQRVQNISTKVYETFGMTETISHIAVRRINYSEKTVIHNIPFTCLPNIEVSVDKENRLTITAPKLLDKPLKTNDIIKLVSDYEFYWIARADYVINSGGIKIHPEIVEQKLQEIIPQRFFVTSLPDDALGEKVVLFVENNDMKLTKRQIKVSLENLKTIHRYEKPKKIFFVKHFYETSSKKMDREGTKSLILEREN